jgi:hypothetical protein
MNAIIYPINPPDPIEAIKLRLEQKGKRSRVLIGLIGQPFTTALKSPVECIHQQCGALLLVTRPWALAWLTPLSSSLLIS